MRNLNIVISSSFLFLFNPNTEVKMKKAEIYGFVGSIGTVIFYCKHNSLNKLKCLVIYLLWAFVPDKVLRKIGISWYPEKYWALAIPSFFIITLLAAQILYQGINMMYTKPFSSIYAIQGRQILRRILYQIR